MTPVSDRQLQNAAEEVKGLRLLPLRGALALTISSGLSLHQVEEQALQCGLLPARFARNHSCIGVKEQLRLHRATVAVAGVGGLGGAVVEALARSGVGALIVIDGDRFEESNLNRQLLCTVDNLGSWKVEAAVQRATALNPAIRMTAHCTTLAAENAAELLAGAQLVADCLDSPHDRTLLADHCNTHNLPLISAAISGNAGQLTTLLPGMESDLYRGKTADTTPGNQAAPAMALAALQAGELLRLLLNRPAASAGELLFCDLAGLEFQRLPLAGSS